MQTIRNTLLRKTISLPGTSHRLLLSLRDGSGDALAAKLDEPERIKTGPLVVLLHGLTGCEDSAYMRASALFHLKRGRRVLRLNQRGAGPSRGSCKGHYHAGCASDIRDALLALDGALLADGLMLVGYSLGGNVLLNLLADPGDDLPIICAASVSAPIEPSRAAQRLMAPRNRLYHDWLLRQMKAEAMAGGAHVSATEADAIQNARTIWDYDNDFIAPRNGFAGAEDYYARTAGARVISRIGVPALLIHARNDPWIPVSSYDALAALHPDNVQFVLPAEGGHVGFHEAGQDETWHDRQIDRFCREVMKKSPDRTT